MERKIVSYKKKLKSVNIIVAMVLLGCIIVVSFFLAVYRKKDRDEESIRSMDNTKVVLDDILNRIQTVRVFIEKSGWSSAYSILDTEAISNISIIEEIKRIEDIATYNSVIGYSSKVAVVFAKAGYVIDINGLASIEDFFGGYYDQNGKSIENSDKFFLASESTVFTKIKHDTYGSVHDVMVLREKSSVSNCFLIYTLDEVTVQRELSKHLLAGISLVALFHGNIILESGQLTANNKFESFSRHNKLYVAVSPKYNIPLYSFIVLMLMISGILIFIALRVLITKYFFNVERQVRLIRENLYSNGDDISAVAALLEESVEELSQKQNEFKKLRENNRESVIQLYVRLILSGEILYDERVKEVLQFVGFSDCDMRVVMFLCDEFLKKLDKDKYVVVNKNCAAIFLHDNVEINGIYAYGGTVKSLAQLPISYKECEANFLSGVLRGVGGRKIIAEELCDLSFDVSKFITHLRKYIMEKCFSGVENLICNTFNQLEKDDNNPYKVLNFFSAIEAAIEELQEGLIVYKLEKLEYNNHTVAEYKERLLSTIRVIIAAANKKVESRYANYFVAIKAYIDSNFTDKNLSLKSISQHFNFSISYISRIFSENGEFHYLEYINMKRIEKAKKLSLQNIKINDISAQCGFDSTVTFRRIFKKIEGVTPSQYKEMKFIL